MRKKPSEAKPERAAGLRLEWRAADTLRAHPQNWRRHPAAQSAALGALMERTGWAGALLLNETTGHLLDGHLRKDLAGKDQVPVLIGSWTEEEERLIVASLDPISGLAETDVTIYANLLDTLPQAGELRTLWLAIEAEEMERPGVSVRSDRGEGVGSTLNVVRILIAVTAVGPIERALAATGQQERGAALLQICEAYLESARRTERE